MEKASTHHLEAMSGSAPGEVMRADSFLESVERVEVRESGETGDVTPLLLPNDAGLDAIATLSAGRGPVAGVRRRMRGRPRRS